MSNLQRENRFCFRHLALVSLGLWACTASAVTIVRSNQVNSIETSLNNAQASAFFTHSPNDGIVFTNIAMRLKIGWQ